MMSIKVKNKMLSKPEISILIAINEPKQKKNIKPNQDRERK